MRAVMMPVFRAAIAHGHVKAAGGVAVRPQHVEPAPDGFLTISNQGAIVLEFRVGDEVIARKVQTSSGEAFWLRQDLVNAAEASLVQEAAQKEKVIREMTEWTQRRDRENAARAGLSVEEYRNKRNWALHRIDARHGRNSIGIR